MRGAPPRQSAFPHRPEDVKRVLRLTDPEVEAIQMKLAQSPGGPSHIFDSAVELARQPMCTNY